jgi:hypothetical protein
MVDVVVTALLVSLCCVVYLFRIPSLCIYTNRYVNNGLISVSPSTDLDGTHFFSVWKETGASFKGPVWQLPSLYPNQLDCICTDINL